jgi:hypothetical protein
MFTGPALGLVSFIFFSYYSPYTVGSSESIVFALAITTFFIVLSHMYFMWHQYNHHVEQTEKIENIIKNSIHIIPVGSVVKAFEYINSRLPSIAEVQNTSFTTPESRDKANYKFYKTDVFEKVNENISKYAATGLFWRDIGDNKDALQEMQGRYDRSMSINKKHKYDYRKIKNKVPKMNFIILKYNNGDEEVLFNWDLRDKSGEPTVYISRDVEIVRMFEVHYTDLWEFSVEAHDNKDTK